METLHADAMHAMRRSHGRFKIWMYLMRQREATIPEIARATGIRYSRIHAALKGNKGTHKREHGLIALGIVRERASRGGHHYALTPAGLAFGRRIAHRTQADPLVREFADLAMLVELEEP